MRHICMQDPVRALSCSHPMWRVDATCTGQVHAVLAVPAVTTTRPLPLPACVILLTPDSSGRVAWLPGICFI